MTDKKSHSLHIQRYLFSGILTLIPLWVTWIVFEYVFKQLSQLGMPWVQVFARSLEKDYPAIATWLMESWIQYALAVIFILIGLYLVGWLSNKIIGIRLLQLFESIISRLPVVQNVYSLVKKLISALRQKPDKLQRVVLIEFPSPWMKTVGFVTRTLQDQNTGEELAAVYVPTTPNPTSGYLEIVPVDQLIATDWTVDEAMNFIISGGAVAPENIPFSNKKKRKPSL